MKTSCFIVSHIAGTGRNRKAELFGAESMHVSENLASRNPEVGALDEAEIPLFEELKQFTVSLCSDAQRHQCPRTQSRFERHPATRIDRTL